MREVLPPTVLSASGIRKSFGALEILKGVDLAVHAGEKVCILGSSGSGKTTFLRCLNLLVEPSHGEIIFKGERVGSWPDAPPQSKHDLCGFRSRIGMVFQQFELFPHLTALANTMLGPHFALGLPKAECRERGMQLLRKVGMDRFAEVYPRTLSGGQKQRVAIARALAMQPDLVLFDEPTSALDAEMVGEVLDLISMLASEGMTMVIVTHELAFARNIADRIIVMDHGVIVEEGPAAQLFSAPQHQRSRDLLRNARAGMHS